MQSVESHWGARALDYVDAIEASKSQACVLSQFERMIGDLGFHAYIMAGIPLPGQSLRQTTIANGWPSEWFELYSRENLSAVDPVPRHCFNTLNPFEWTEAPYDREREPAAHQVMERAHDFRFNNGFCIPIHYDNETGAISIAGEQPELDPERKSALHLMSVFTHSRLRALSKPKACAPARHLNNIEAEVLRWAARGKTAWETSQILDISERNVRWHLEEAQRKLMTKNKTATVAVALVNGEILL
jgi:LuxR family quorum sensing-dependent transcriptional regulator